MNSFIGRVVFVVHGDNSSRVLIETKNPQYPRVIVKCKRDVADRFQRQVWVPMFLDNGKPAPIFPEPSLN